MNIVKHFLNDIVFVAKKNKISFSLVMLTNLISPAAKILTPVVLLKAIKNLTDEDVGPPEVYYPFLAYIGLWTLGCTAGGLRTILISTSSSTLAHSLTDKVIGKYFQMPYVSRANNSSTIEIQMFINNYNRVAAKLLLGVFGEMVPSVIEIFGTIGVFLWFDKLVGATLAGTMLIYFILVFFTSKKVDQAQAMWNKTAFSAVGTVMEALSHYESAHYNGKVHAEMSKLNTALTRFDKAFIYSQRVQGVIDFIQHFSIGGCFAGSLALIAHKSSTTNESNDNAFLLIFYLIQISEVFRIFASSMLEIREGATNYAKCITHLNAKHEFSDQHTKPAINLDMSSRGLKIEFRNVCLRHPTQDKNLLTDINFIIEPGQCLVLVGVSGSGKSSILNLLFGFYKPSSGQIFVNDTDISTINLQSLREYFAVIPQSIHLMNETLQANVGYSCEKSDSDEIACAIGQAKLDGLVKKIPADFKIGEEGRNLSGGQKQRVSIARAVLRAHKGARVFLVDEATSALDKITAKHIIMQIYRICAQLGLTSLVITHDLTQINVDFVNKVVMLDINGRIVDQGSVQELIRSQGLFSQTIREQGISEEALLNSVMPAWEEEEERLGMFFTEPEHHVFVTNVDESFDADEKTPLMRNSVN